MSYQHTHLLSSTPQHLTGVSDSLRLSREAAQSFALRQAVAEQRVRTRTRRPARVSAWGRARRALSRPRPA